MVMTPYSRNYLLATAAVTIITVVAVLLTSDSFLDNLLVIIAVGVTYPCTMLGLYLFLEGKDYRWINGPDWVSMTDQERINAVSYIGIYMVIGCILLGLAIVSMFANFVIGIVLIVVSVVIMVAPILRKDRMRSFHFVQRSTAKKMGIFIAVSVIAIVPCTAIGLSEFTTETVIVEIGEDGLHIKAPMVDKSFDYDKIQDLEIDPDFDKGTRIAGYGTPTICSGTFSNGQFGTYTLASYTKVKPCVFFLYDGDYYAFNQADNEKTQQVYEELLTKINL